MKRKWLLAGLVAVAVGCDSMSHTESNALGGTAIGAGIGALAGHALGNTGAGAAIGAATGLVAGGLTGAAQDRRDERRVAAAPAYANAHPPVSLQDVVQMTHQHIPEDIIIRQIDTTNSVYSLSVDDIAYLRGNGVNDRVIGYMQARRGAVVVQPVPAPATRVYVV